MIRYHIDGQVRDFCVDGDVRIIAVEATTLFTLLHGQLRKIHPETAEAFKASVIDVIGNPDHRMWSVETPESFVGDLFVFPEGEATRE